MNSFEKREWEWQELPRPAAPAPRTGLDAVKLLIPFVIAGLFLLWGRTILGSIVAAIGTLFLLLRFLAPSALESILALLAALGRWLGKIAGVIGLTIVYALVFTPAAFLARLFRQDPLAIARVPGTTSYWVEVPQVDHARLAAKPFLLETREGAERAGGNKVFRVGRAVYHTALTLFVLNLAAGWIYRDVIGVRDVTAQRERGYGDPRSKLPVYENQPWAKDYFKELADSTVMAYRPFIGWSRRDYQGRYINVVGNHRLSYRPSMDGKPALKLYTFGASAMWGIGARDDFTIASYLAKFAEQDGVALHVENFAENAFVNWQNVVHLSELCAAGRCPDIAIFYEGAGDAGAKIQTPQLTRVHENFDDWQVWIEDHDSVERWFKQRSLIHILGRALGAGRGRRRLRDTVLSTETERVNRMAQELVTTYEENAAFVNKLGEAYGFKAFFFWQPVVYTRKTPTDDERRFHRVFGEMMPALYRAATREVQSRDFVVDLSTTFDDVQGNVYIDWAHLGEAGNEMVARKIYASLRPAILAAANTQSARANALGAVQ